MNDLILWKLHTKPHIGLCCLQKLAQLGTLHHGSDIGKINLLIKASLIIIVYHAGNTAMNTAVRSNHQYLHLF